MTSQPLLHDLCHWDWTWFYRMRVKAMSVSGQAYNLLLRHLPVELEKNPKDLQEITATNRRIVIPKRLCGVEPKEALLTSFE